MEQHFDDLTKISIHALRVEGDAVFVLTLPVQFRFLSTPSGWRATLQVVKDSRKVVISIHALRVEGDFHNSCTS